MSGGNGARHGGYELPHHAEMEASILGGILLDNGVLSRLETLEVDDFYDARHRVVFAAIRNLEAAGRPIDVVLLEAEIARVGKLDAIGGPALLGELVLAVPTTANVEHYRDVVKLDSRNRRVILELSSALERAKRGVYDPDELLIETVGELQRLAPENTASGSQRWCTPLVEFLGEEEPSDDDSEEWIIRDLIPRGEPSLFVGRAKGGKTWAMLALAICIAMGWPWLGPQGFANTMGGPARVLVIALEDSERRLRKRLWELCRALGISPNNRTLQQHLIISRHPLRLPDRDDQRAIERELKAWRPAAVLLDNLTRIMCGDQNKTQDASLFCNLWLQMCMQVGANFTYLHHVTKALGEDAKVKGDPFERIRGAGAFVDAARHVVLTTPLDVDGRQLSEVRMRGNLDIRREPFLVEFERRVDEQGRRSVHLHDKGAAAAVIAELSQQKRDAVATEKTERMRGEYERRRQLAIDTMKTNRALSSRDFAKVLGMGDRTAAAVLYDLARDGVFRRDRNNGYVFAEEDS